MKAEDWRDRPMAEYFLNLVDFAAYLRAGGVGAMPTDTVPGLVCLPEYAEQIYALKGRDEHKPLILLGAAAADLAFYTAQWRSEWTELAERGWPGALTLVLPVGGRVPAAVHRGGGTVGVRIPNHPDAHALLAKTGPLASTSANRSGQPVLIEPQAIRRTFAGVALLAGTYRGSGTASTVVRWEDDGWQVLRQGDFKL
ncbi:glr3274 [Gloeobacter violaceus PCC 7421]|uniref:L-threonylcarbamoyladenylate synthase n=2 Tax=Gloeobacter violaceus TaxID=33072 RepID=Q7NG99_GLOVI|nr:glr3274 [Gloeobacter violaceus PCC 7421]